MATEARKELTLKFFVTRIQPKDWSVYRDAFEKKHGPNSDWIKQPVDGSVLYQACGGKPHGRFSICDGVISTPTVVCNGRAESSSGEMTQQNQERFEAEVNERINKTVEDKISHIQEQMQQQISNQVLAAVNATNEYWMKYLQGTSSSEVARHEASNGDSADGGTNGVGSDAACV